MPGAFLSRGASMAASLSQWGVQRGASDASYRRCPSSGHAPTLRSETI